LNWEWDRATKYLAVAFGVVLMVPVGCTVWFFYMMGTYEDVERARFPNPVGSIEVVVVDRLSNTTVPNTEVIYIVPAKAKTDGDPLLVWSDSQGIDVTWSSNDSVLIHADSARVDGGKDYGRQDIWMVGGKVKKVVHINYDITHLQQR